MQGGPSHVDLFDPKPELSKHYGGETTFIFVNRASKKRFRKPLDVRRVAPGIAPRASHTSGRAR